MSVLRRSVTAAVTLAVSLSALGAVSSPAAAAVGDEMIAWAEVEDGVISGGPALNSGDHGNFSGTGSYTFRETGMTSTMSVTAPAAGVYPVYVRYAAGPLSAGENVTRSMGLLTNGGNRQVVSYPMTSFEDWETWRVAQAQVTLQQGANTIAINCDRSTDFCRLNFDAIQVGGTAFDPCVATDPTPGWRSLFDGTFASFDGWRKAGGGGFGRQTDCTLQAIRGRGATWFTQQQTAPYTLELDWRRNDANDDSSVHLASSSRGGADPVGGVSVRIGADTGAVVPAGGTAQAARAAAVTEALRPVGEWNTFRIELTRARVKVHLNGTLVNSVARPAGAAAAGFVGLANLSDSDRVSFRDVRVESLDELGTLAQPFRRAVLADGSVNAGGESTLANLVAESQRRATQEPASGNARIALVSPLDLEADLVGEGDPATVTYEDVVKVVAADPLVNVRLTGARLRAALEQQWQRTAAGSVPGRPFLRLGTSSGFRYTYDPTATEGSRITGMWLDDVAVDPAGSYSVTMTSSLAEGDDNFHALAEGTGERDAMTDAQTALVDHVSPEADPLTPDATQHSVGVTFPGGSSSYAAGGVLAVDLTSWSFSAASDPKDASVQVSLGGRSLGAFPVDHALGDEPVDEQGRVAVRAPVPAATPVGATTVRIVGTTTGTAVELPVTVTAAPTPAPAPKATPRMKVTVKPRKVIAGRTTAKLAVVVKASGHAPTGTVKVKVGGKTYAGTLKKGRATVTLPRFAKAGTVRAKVTYGGDARTTKASTTVKITVTKRARR